MYSSVEPAGDSITDIIITVATNSSDPPMILADQLTRPLEQTLEEVTDINEQISFTITTSQRYDVYIRIYCMYVCVHEANIIMFEPVHMALQYMQ